MYVIDKFPWILGYLFSKCSSYKPVITVIPKKDQKDIFNFTHK